MAFPPGQRQYHEKLDTTPATPLRKTIREAFLCIASAMSQDEILEMSEDLAGQSELIQLARLTQWLDYAEAAHG
jgi:hypothetical protein